MQEYRVIQEFYGTRTAKRSNVPLMNHIDEGLALLRWWRASRRVRAAYCIHPIVQNDEPVDVTWSDSFGLAKEYKDKANAYLCREETDHICTSAQVHLLVGDMSQECALLLLADKMQNLKDFRKYHRDHPREKQLKNYFMTWICFLQEQVRA